jgi:hypothetical protein
LKLYANAKRLKIGIVLMLVVCCGLANSAFMPQTSQGQSIPTDTMNSFLFSSTKLENTTNISSDAVNEQSMEPPIEAYNVTNLTAGSQPSSESEETPYNVSEIKSNLLANKSQEVSAISEFFESGSLDKPPTIPDPKNQPDFAIISCSTLINPCVGTDLADDMTGDDGQNEMFGKKGEDKLSGGAGDDYMEGNEDQDQMYGEDGADFMIGEHAYDYMNGGNNDDWMLGVWEYDAIIGEAGNDVISGGHGTDSLWGGTGDDVVSGGDGDDGGVSPYYGIINGQEGNDYLTGDAGADRILGSEGDDTIFHHDSNQESRPDGAKDIINCGPGNDVAWISRIADGDTAENCETLHTDQVRPDSDGDGIPDDRDNCINVSNRDQLDYDEDGKGDRCDHDDDNDQRADPGDNCGYKNRSYLAHNPDQRDEDHDGHGDACDETPI